MDLMLEAKEVGMTAVVLPAGHEGQCIVTVVVSVPAALTPAVPPAVKAVVEACAEEGDARLEATEAAAEAPEAEAIDMMLETKEVGITMVVLPAGQEGQSRDTVAVVVLVPTALILPAPPAAVEVVEACAEQGDVRQDATEAAAEAPEAEAMDMMLDTADVGTGIPMLPPGQAEHGT